MSRKLSFIGPIAVASLFLFPIQTFATPGSKHGNRHIVPTWHSGPVWGGWHFGPGWGGPEWGMLNGMAVPDGAGTGGAVAGGEVMA
jgi:hypothetical protein